MKFKVIVEYEVECTSPNYIPSENAVIDNVISRVSAGLGYGGNLFWSLDEGTIKVKATQVNYWRSSLSGFFKKEI